MRIKFVSNAAQVERKLNEISKKLSDFRSPLRETEKMQKREINEAFNVAGKNINGRPWRQLRPNTIAEKLKHGYVSNILVRTGKMRKSFVTKLLSKTQLSIGNSADYFPQHQQGEPKKDLPQRQILGHSQKMIDKTIKIFKNYIEKILKV